MEIKKLPKADLEGKRIFFREIGLVVVLFVVYLCFQWSTKDVTVEDLSIDTESIIEDEVISTRIEKKKITPPKQKVVEVIEVVDDEVELDEEDEPDFNEDVDLDDEIEVIEMDDEEDDNVVFKVVQDMPEFPGGLKALYKFIYKYIKYPAVAAESGIQGKVFLKFVVTKSGKVDRIQVLRGVDPTLNKEAIRVVRMLPRFTPGKQRGKSVNVWYQLPVTFRLQ